MVSCISTEDQGQELVIHCRPEALLKGTGIMRLYGTRRETRAQSGIVRDATRRRPQSQADSQGSSCDVRMWVPP